jgi:crossover junction endodeoxyribonuclease RuvC
MKNTQPLTILGIDPGYDRLGWGIGQFIGNKWQNLSYDCIETPKKMELFDRYQLLQQELTAVIKKHKPGVVAIETLLFSKNKTTALKVSEARGIIISTCLNAGLKIHEFNPMQIKLAAAGHGRADKKAVEKMVRLQLNLNNEKIIDDAIDALAVMMTYQTQRKLLEL